MDAWTLRDGTTVNLGGDVVGSGVLAELVKAEMADARRGLLSSGYGLEPHLEVLDVDVPHLLDFYLRRRFDIASGPVVRYPDHTVREDPPEGAIF